MDQVRLILKEFTCELSRDRGRIRHAAEGCVHKSGGRGSHPVVDARRTSLPLLDPRDAALSSITDKAKKHVVRPEGSDFLVESASSKKTYRVTLSVEGAIGSAKCSCEYAIHRPNGPACSHLLAVFAFAKASHVESGPETEF